jgi:hypothetical protein
MVTPTEFVSMLVMSIIELVVTFAAEVFLGVDPITAAIFLVGGALTTAAVAIFGVLVLGAAVDAVTG